MECLLNLAWVLVAAALLAWWPTAHPRVKAGRGQQLVALGLLLVFLFPAISITDDLWAANHFAEADVLLRRRPDGVMQASMVHPEAVLFVGAVFQPDAPVRVEYAAFRSSECAFHETPSCFRLFIRPPPVL